MKKIIYFLCFFISMGNTFGQSGYIDSLKSGFGKTSNLREKFSILQKINEAYIFNGVGDSKVEGNLEMIKIAQQLNSDTLSGYAYYMTGIFYIYNKCDFNAGLDYDFKGIQYAEKAHDTTTMVGALIDISMAYSNLNNISEQLKFVKQAEKNLPNKNNPDYNYLSSQVQCGYGIHYLNVKQPKLALQYIFAANEAGAKLNNPVLEGFYQTYFGLVYQQTGNKREKIKQYNLAASKNTIQIIKSKMPSLGLCLL